MNAKRFYDACYVVKVRGGKSPLWVARMHDTNASVQGSSKTADGAIKDLQKQYRLRYGAL